MTLALTIREGWQPSLPAWARRWLLLAVKGWFAWAGDLRQWNRPRDMGGIYCRPIQRIFRNWWVAVMLGAVFVWLFAEANPVIFRGAIELKRQIWRLFDDLVVHFPTSPRMATWLMIAMWVWAFLRFRSKVFARPGTPAAGEVEGGAIIGSPASIVRCL